MNIAIVLGSLLIVGIFIIWYIDRDAYILKLRNGEEFDLKPGYNLTQGLSIITLYQGSKGYNFMVDTGSNYSHIVSTSDMRYVLTGQEGQTYGLGADSITARWATVTLFNEKIRYDFNVMVGDVDVAMEALKVDTGVKVDGILGSDFLTKYDKVLDYKNMMVHTAK